MAGSPSIEQIVAQIRTAIFGKDVRENIALGIEKCYSEVPSDAVKYTAQSLTTAQKTQARTNIGAVNASVQQISGTTSDYKITLA